MWYFLDRFLGLPTLPTTVPFTFLDRSLPPSPPAFPFPAFAGLIPSSRLWRFLNFWIILFVSEPTYDTWSRRQTYHYDIYLSHHSGGDFLGLFPAVFGYIPCQVRLGSRLAFSRMRLGYLCTCGVFYFMDCFYVPRHTAYLLRSFFLMHWNSTSISPATTVFLWSTLDLASDYLACDIFGIVPSFLNSAYGTDLSSTQMIMVSTGSVFRPVGVVLG